MSEHDRDTRSPDAPRSGGVAEPESARKEKLIAIGFTALMGAVVVGALMFGRADRVPDPSAALIEGPPAAETVGEAPEPDSPQIGSPDVAPP